MLVPPPGAGVHWQQLQMDFSSSEVSCRGCELTRLWILCRADPRGLVRLSGLGSRRTHPWKLPSSAHSWSSTLPIWERQSWLLQDKYLAIFYLPRRRLPVFLSKASKCVCINNCIRVLALLSLVKTWHHILHTFCLDRILNLDHTLDLNLNPMRWHIKAGS